MHVSELADRRVTVGCLWSRWRVERAEVKVFVAVMAAVSEVAWEVVMAEASAAVSLWSTSDCFLVLDGKEICR